MNFEFYLVGFIIVFVQLICGCPFGPGSMNSYIYIFLFIKHMLYCLYSYKEVDKSLTEKLISLQEVAQSTEIMPNEAIEDH